MEIIRSRYAGACYGVKRALSLVDAAAAQSAGNIHTLGPLIHNPQVVRELRSKGVLEASAVEDVATGVLVIRSHGVAPCIIEQAQAQGLEVVDATCPHVTKAQLAARQLYEKGYQVLIIGERGHPEVKSIQAYAENQAIVVEGLSDLPKTFASHKIGIVVQTTQTEATLKAVVQALEKRGITPVVQNTICFATRQRQEAACELAGKVEVMLVIGGRNSGNTTRLAQLCSVVCPQTHLIERADELERGWFEGAQTVGITAGASTPEDQIIAIERALEALL